MEWFPACGIPLALGVLMVNLMISHSCNVEPLNTQSILSFSIPKWVQNVFEVILHMAFDWNDSWHLQLSIILITYIIQQNRLRTFIYPGKSSVRTVSTSNKLIVTFAHSATSPTSPICHLSLRYWTVTWFYRYEWGSSSIYNALNLWDG